MQSNEKRLLVDKVEFAASLVVIESLLNPLLKLSRTDGLYETFGNLCLAHSKEFECRILRYIHFS
ncbi:hypothetical protein ACSBR2_033786 [Camellia fascicularis]